MRWAILSVVCACATDANVGRSTLEADDPTVPPKIDAYASLWHNAEGWVLTITNVRSTTSCEPANAAAGENVAGMFRLEARVSGGGDLGPGQYAATATFAKTDATCATSIGEVTADVTLGVDTAGDSRRGILRAQFPSGLFLASFDAPECPAPIPDASSCRTLPPCSADAGMLCITTP